MEIKGKNSSEIGDPFAQRIRVKGMMVLDGALGTQLEVKGADIKNGLWSASLLKTHPELIRAVHLDYLNSGADIIATAGYQASIPAFIKNGYSLEEGKAMIQKSMELAREAREIFQKDHPDITHEPLIAASIGPYGAYLANGSEYHGNYDIHKKELIEFHTLGIKMNQDLKADILAFETVPSLEEALAIVEALKGFPEQRAWISFSCRNGTEVSHGEKLGECIREIQDSNQILAMGINCTAPEFVESLIHQIASHTHKWIMVYPNKGEVYDAERKHWTQDHAPLDYIEYAQIWFNAGARIIGGCCGTGPEHIRELVQLFSH